MQNSKTSRYNQKSVIRSSGHRSAKYDRVISDKKPLIFGVGLAVLIILIVVLISLDENTPRNYYMKDLFVTEATILQTSAGDDNKTYGIQVQLNNPPKTITLEEDNTWVGVDQQFYTSHTAGQHIGVLVCNYDVMKANNFGLFGEQGQSFEKEMWAVDSAYDSLNAAQTQYPHRQFSGKASLKSKTKLSSGELYFVLEYDGREMTSPVDDSTFSRYNIGDSVSCAFDGYGDFIKTVSIS